MISDYSGRLRSILHEKKLSVTDFCKLIGLNSTGTIHKLLTDNRKPSSKTVQRIITAFPDISEEWLLYGKEEDKQSKEEDRTVTAQQVIDYMAEQDRPHPVASILDKLDEIADMFQGKIDSKETEMLKLKETVLIMHKNSMEISKKINSLTVELNNYLNNK